jgi:hypothetical protein
LLIAGIVATKFQNMRVIVVTAGNIICVMGSAMMAFLPANLIWGRLIGFWLSKSGPEEPFSSWLVLTSVHS